MDTAYCPFTSYDTKTFASFTKYLAKQNKTITVPSAGDSFGLGNAEVTVLGPISISADDTNNSSIVLRIVYGKTSFLLTGDAEWDEEREIIDSGADIASTVLKVGHHGSSFSTSIYFLREVAPEYAVISVGEGNSYGHPTEQTLSRLRDADVKTYRTDMQGDIICTSDGKNVKFKTEKNADADT
ncbi:MAG: MBL fold metallo-hydrolase, partial [Clostridiales bacterium]|nr:MBL fold metallo-hydrolase [Clostridiales bacterium]